MTPTDFLNTYGNYAVKGSRFTGVFPSTILAQAILESGWGGSGLTQNANNFFGIKADSTWKGKSYNADTQEFENNKYITINDNFRAYDTAKESFSDHIKFLKENSRYKDNGVFSAKTPQEQVQALQTAKYATSPVYADKLMSLINQYELTTYDKKQKIQNVLLISFSGFTLLGVSWLVLNQWNILPTKLQIKQLKLKSLKP